MKKRTHTLLLWLAASSGLVTFSGCATGRPDTTIAAPAPGSFVDRETPDTTPAVPVVAVAAAKASTPAVKVRSVEGITEYRLGNGMQVLLFPDASQASVTVNITYLVGSRMEGYGEAGMAHLLEHMMFKGSKTYRNVLKLIDERGGQANGTTWTDRTNYYETLPASDENLNWALDLEADRMLHATILPEDLATEFSVVRNEFEMGENNPQSILEERMASTAFLWHNYGKSTIGSRADIEKVPVPALRAFYEKYYQPDNAVLVVAGKFDEAAALTLVEKKFGVLAKPSRVITATYTVEPPQDGEREVVLRRNGDVAVTGAMWHTPGAASPDFVAVNAGLDILTREPSGRLYKKLVDSKLAADLSGSAYNFRDPYVTQIIAQVRDVKNVDRVLAEITAAVEGLAASKIDAVELERWRDDALKQYDLMFTDSRRLAVELSEAIALGDWRTLFASREQIKKVTLADVTRVAKTYFKKSNRTSGRFLPTKENDRAPQDATPDVASIVQGIESGAAAQAGEEFAATHENIDARTVRKELKGGIRAALVSKKTRGGKVELALTFRFGDEKSLQKQATVGELAIALLERGTTKKTYTEISDLENKLKSQVSVSGGAGSMRIGIKTLRDQLAPALDLAAEIATSPSFPAAELEVVRQQTLAALEEQRQDPQSLGFLQLQRALSKWSKDDPRYVMSIEEQIDAVKRVKIDDIKAFYRNFVGAGRGELTVVGDFDADKVTAQIEKLFGGWVSKKPFARLVDQVFDVTAGEQVIDTKDKEMAALAMGFSIAMRSDDPDYAAWLIVGQVLGGDTGSRLWMRVREKEGLSYGTGAWTSADDEDTTGSFGAYAIVAPANMNKAKASILEEVNKMAGGDVTDVELARAKEGWAKQEDTNLSNDGYVRSTLGRNAYLGRTMAWHKALRAKIAAVTAADVARVAKKYLDPKKLVVIVAGDVAKSNAGK